MDTRSGEGMVTGDGKGLAGRQAEKTGGGSGRGRKPGRRTTTTTKVQGVADSGRIQGEDRRRQAGAGGARRDPGHSHDGGPRWSRQGEEPWWRKG